MRAILDRVVFVRALINPHSGSGRLLFGDLVERYTIVLSPAIIEEILDVIFRPALRQRFPQMASPPHVQAILQILEDAEVVEPVMRLSVCRDPSDNKFLECAIEAGAEYVVTEDRDLLDIRAFRGVSLITIVEFIALLEATRLR